MAQLAPARRKSRQDDPPTFPAKGGLYRALNRPCPALERLARLLHRPPADSMERQCEGTSGMRKTISFLMGVLSVSCSAGEPPREDAVLASTTTEALHSDLLD